MKNTENKNTFQLSKMDMYLIIAIIALATLLAMVFLHKGESAAEPVKAKIEMLPEQDESNSAEISVQTVQKSYPFETQELETETTAVASSEGESKKLDDEFYENLPSYLSQQNERLRSEALANQNNPEKSPLVLTPEAVDKLEKSGNIIQ